MPARQGIPVESAAGPASGGPDIPGPLPWRFTALAEQELRTPLASVHVALQLALAGSRELLRAEDREMLEVSVKSTERLVRWVNGMLGTPGAPLPARPVFGPVAVAPLVEEAVRAMRPMALAHSMTLDAQYSPGLPMVDANREALARILSNLLAHLIEQTPRGTRIVAGARAAAGGVELTVGTEFAAIDGGTRAETAGLAGDERGSHAAAARLTMCRALVEQHGGRLRTLQAEGAGPRFSFTLPCPAEGGSAPSPVGEQAS